VTWTSVLRLLYLTRQAHAPLFEGQSSPPVSEFPLGNHRYTFNVMLDVRFSYSPRQDAINILRGFRCVNEPVLSEIERAYLNSPFGRLTHGTAFSFVREYVASNAIDTSAAVTRINTRLSFNPHPASLPGDAKAGEGKNSKGVVSIRTRHRCRVMLAFHRQSRWRSKFQSAPGIAAG
jgi:hypothetical protein